MLRRLAGGLDLAVEQVFGAETDALVLLCQRCGRPFQTDVIRALCGACQRAQEVAG